MLGKNGFVKRLFKVLASGALSVCFVAPAHADGSSAGTVGLISVISGALGAPGAEDFRVTLSGSPVICNGQTWAYIDANDPNYSGIVATVLDARLLSTVVTLYWTQTTAGYCKITWMQW